MKKDKNTLIGMIVLSELILTTSGILMFFSETPMLYFGRYMSINTNIFGAILFSVGIMTLLAIYYLGEKK